MIYEAIEQENSPQLKKFLLGAFTSMIHLCTRMMPVGTPAPSNHYTFFSSPGWTQHSYWSAPHYMEQNVWDKFEGAVTGNQGIINAKNESNELLGDVKVTNDWQKVLDGEADIAIVTDDCVELMKKMPEESVDYMFTDPPYDASIQYGELSYLWNAWLKADYRYTENIVTHEVIRNERQKKPFEVYHALLNSSFQGFYKVLRPERCLTLTFHNPTFMVRNATVRAGVFSGFDYEHIHHQPLGQVSAKAMMQPFGSAQGDFYLRFVKTARPARQMEEISEERFRRIVIDTCREVIASRAEPTPYTILINQVDPVLAKRGLFGTLHTGLDVKTVLEESVGKEFELVDAKMGGASGKLWWFADKTFAARLGGRAADRAGGRDRFSLFARERAGHVHRSLGHGSARISQFTHLGQHEHHRGAGNLRTKSQRRLVDVERRNPVELVAPQRTDRVAGKNRRGARTRHLDRPA